MADQLYNLEAERAALGAALLDAAAAAAVRGALRAEDFSKEGHRAIYNAIARSVDRGQPCDPVTVGGVLRQAGDLENAGGMAYLSSLLDACPATSAAGHYIKIITDNAKKRRLRGTLAGIMTSIDESGQSAEELTSQAEQAIFAISTGRAGEDQQRSAAEYLRAFLDKIMDSAAAPAISTGFYNLDNALDGGLYPGLYILGAISSAGKTSYALQLADQLAQRGQDVLFFSLEMAREELIAKSISRNTFLLAGEDQSQDAKTARGIMAGAKYATYSNREKALIKQAIGTYREYAGNLFIFESCGNFGAEQISQEIRRHIVNTGKRPAVFVDYLQILAPYDTRSSDKQNTDKAVLELKRISRAHEIPVIAISSLNRKSYSSDNPNRGRVSMADFKESGAIEYSADVLLALEFTSAGGEDYNEKSEKQNERREMALQILKNRNGKIPKEGLKYKYYCWFNCFTEESEDRPAWSETEQLSTETKFKVKHY